MIRITQSEKGVNIDNGRVTPTVRDIAHLARVSVATVSRVVNGNTNVSAQKRESVERAIQLTGYKPNPTAVHLSDLKKTKRRRKQPPLLASHANPLFALKSE